MLHFFIRVGVVARCRAFLAHSPHAFQILVRVYNEQIRGLERVAEAWKDYKGLWGEDPYEEEDIPSQP